MNRMIRGLTAVGHSLWRPWLRRRLGRVVLEHLDGVPLVVLPEVFHPAVFRSGTLLAHALARADELAPVPAGHALDMGTGSGVGAVFAARRGWRVVAVDINPEAVRCARINVALNGLEETVEVRGGDLYSPVAGERFDLVTFNPPYFRGPPRGDLDAAWRSQDVLERFATGLPGALRPGGRALLVLSTDGEGDRLLGMLADEGFILEAIARRRFGNEVLTAWLASSGPGGNHGGAP